MNRSRVGNKMDAGRLAALVAMPGIDPRVWCALCVVDKMVVDDDGVFADVHILATASADEDGNITAQKTTVRVGADYAGDGFGFYSPLEEGEEVVVVWPHGDPDHGGIIVARNWSPAEPPPGTAKDSPTDVLLVAKRDVNIRIVAQGSGNISIVPDDGKVLLGGESGGKPVHRQTDPVAMGTFIFIPAAGPGVVTGGSLVVIPPGGATAQAVTVPASGAPLTGAATDGSGNVEST